MRAPFFAALLLLATQVAANNPELAAMAADDQAVRAGKADTSSDDARRQRVMALLAEGAVTSPRDKFHAALILQHTGMEFCDGQLRSLSAENYLLASLLFAEALKGGIDDARYLVAASTDRYLSVTTGMQRYGTNRVFDQETGEEQLVPIDRTTSDADRAKYGVPTLADLLAKWPEQKRAVSRE